MCRFLMIKNRIITKESIQMRFSIAANKLDVLVRPEPMVGLKRNVEIMYGALQAIQKYVSNLVGGVIPIEDVSLGQL
jgi:hypothetical protein